MSLGFLIALVALGGFFLALSGAVAAAETAFTRVNRTRADAIAAADDNGGVGQSDARIQQLRGFARRPATTLGSLALVQLVSQGGAIACGWMIGNSIADGFGGVGGIIGAGVTAAGVFTVTVMGRARALAASDEAAVKLVPLLRAVSPLGAISAGLVRFARRNQSPVNPDPDVDEQQLLAIVGETAAIQPEEEVLLKRAVAFDDTTVGAIMTPRGDMITLRSGFAVRDALQVAALHGVSRIPVTSIDGEVDDIIGAIHVNDLWRAHLDGRGAVDIDLWLREVPVVPEVQRAARLLTELQRSDMHLSVVIDEHGGVAGIATLEDILEELVGEIEDEFDEAEPDVVVVDARTVVVDGRCEVTRLNEILGTTISGDFRTIAGAIFNALGRVPDVGDIHMLDDEDLELRVDRMHGRRIADVRVGSRRPFGANLVES